MLPADVWVWATFGVLLVLMAARAWVVETASARLGRTPVREQVLNGAVVAALVALVVLVTVNGGAELVGMLVSGTDTPAPPVVSTDQAPADPGPAAGVNAPDIPPAGQAPGAGAPPGGAPAPAAPAPGGQGPGAPAGG